MRNKQCITWNMASSTEKHENGKKAHSMTWIMARNTEKRGK
jgi:hypothetical protein